MSAISLRGYQGDVVNGVRKAYSSGSRAPLVVLPTGGGKTTIFSYVTKSAVEKDKCVWLVAHRAELIKQIAMTLAKFGCMHQVIAPAAIMRQCKVEQFKEFGRSYVAHSPKVYVASVQTLVKRMHLIEHKPDIIVIDEAHHLTDGTLWGQVCDAYPNAKLLPVTATPIRLDGKGLGVGQGGFADDIIIGPTMRWLIDSGYLSEYRVYAPPNTLDLSRIKMRMGDYSKKELNETMDKPTITGDAVSHYLRLAHGKRAVVFCVSVAHAEHVADEFSRAGVPSVFLDGSLDPAERDKRIKAFERGETLVLTSCDVVSEGFDLPAIEVAILLRPTKSLSLYLQQVGRALRVFEGKTEAIILDHVGAVARHGLPDQEHDWSLDGRKKGSRAANDNAEPVMIMTCPECYAIHAPAPTCEACGFVYTAKQRAEMEVIAGDLVELGREQKAALRAQAEAEKKEQAIVRKREDAKAETLSDLIQLGVSRGYKFPQQWAENKFQVRQAKKSGVY